MSAPPCSQSSCRHRGRTFLDRELYLPKSWIDDRERCTQAGVPAGVVLATKPVQAIAMLRRALDAGVPASWVTADAVYGRHAGLRTFLESRQMSYVLAIATNQQLLVERGEGPSTKVLAHVLAASLAPQAFKRISAGSGSKGPRVYNWVRLALAPLNATGEGNWLLVLRSLTDLTDVAYYVCSGPAHTKLGELVAVAGTRWAIEETFQTGKNEVGLGQYQVRRFDGWYRRMTLAMFAHAFLPDRHPRKSPKRGVPGPVGDLIPLTVPEIRRLLTRLIWHQPPTHDLSSPGHVGDAAPSPSPTLPLRSPRCPTVSAAVVLGAD